MNYPGVAVPSVLKDPATATAMAAAEMGSLEVAVKEVAAAATNR